MLHTQPECCTARYAILIQTVENICTSWYSSRRGELYIHIYIYYVQSCERTSLSYRIALGASPPTERRISAKRATPWAAATFAASQQFAAGRPAPARGDIARGRDRRSLTARHLHGGDLRAAGRLTAAGRLITTTASARSSVAALMAAAASSTRRSASTWVSASSANDGDDDTGARGKRDFPPSTHAVTGKAGATPEAHPAEDAGSSLIAGGAGAGAGAAVAGSCLTAAGAARAALGPPLLNGGISTKSAGTRSLFLW